MGHTTDFKPDKRLTRLRWSWSGLIGAALALALVVAMLAQARQFALLRQAMQASDEQAVDAVYEARVQTLQLREHWRPAQIPAAPGTDHALRAHFTRWQQAAAGLQSTPVALLLGAEPAYAGLSAALAQFTLDAEAALAQADTSAPDRDLRAATLPALQALDEPLQQLARAAADLVAQRTAQRATALQQQNHWGLALTVFMAGLSVALAWMLVRDLHRLRRRRKSLERQARALEQARRDAELASESKSVFLANMSHEVRTPFHGLMGMLSLLRETGLTPRQLDYLRTATESADHLLAILNDILDMSQLETGRMTVTPAAFDLRELLRDVEHLMRPQAGHKALALHVETDPQLPERVVGDRTRVKQILFNLLSNAIKFSDRGAVVLDVRNGTASDGSALMSFMVSDTGIGMDEATRSQLFSRFMHSDSTQGRDRVGTGLGLEISRGLARLMHGEITASSRPGEGSVFTFTVPLLLAPAEADDSLTPPATAAMRPAAQRLHVLVAEDQPVNRQYMAALLDNLGHHTHFTANGQEALQAVQQQGFDLVLMDLQMPVLDGVSATRLIRALPNRAAATVPIVALTADVLEQTRQRCLVAGMNDFLAKPVSPQKLAGTLRRLFGSAACETRNTPDLELPVPRPADSRAVIDEATLQQALQAMPRDRLASLIDAFLSQGPQTVQRLRAAVRDAQPLELRTNAHAARGAALNLGLRALAATAEALHEGATHLPAHEIARLVQHFDDLLPLTRDAVRAAGLHPAADVVKG